MRPRVVQPSRASRLLRAVLVEECRLRLDEPVDDLLPELAHRRVLVDPFGPLDGETIPAVRPITVRDVLTMRVSVQLRRTGSTRSVGSPGWRPRQLVGDPAERLIGVVLSTAMFAGADALPRPLQDFWTTVYAGRGD